MQSAASTSTRLLRPTSSATAVAARAATLPAGLLVPGLGAFAVSCLTFWQYQRAHPGNGLDLGIYRDAAQSFLAGLPVYDLRFALGLPFTYPPVTLPLLAPLAALTVPRALHVLMALTVAAVFLSVLAATGLAGYRGLPGRIGVAGAATGLALWCEPIGSNLALGQINALLVLLVVADMALPDRARGKGLGVGVATACKLTPGIFVVYLLLTRRRRAAGVAAAGFAAVTLAGWLVAPQASNTYWLHGLFLDPGRVSGGNGPAFVANQSVRGVLVRSLGDTAAAARLWTVAVVVIGVAGVALAVLAHRRGEEAVAVLSVAFTGLLVSPVSWSHHWVWVALLLPLLLDVAHRSRGLAQHLAAATLLAWVVALLTWPLRPRPADPVQATGLLWVGYRQPQPLHWLCENGYVLAVLVTMLSAACWLYRPAAPRPFVLPSRPLAPAESVAAVPASGASAGRVPVPARCGDIMW